MTISHSRRGMAWEQLIELHGARYEKLGQAVLLRTPPPMKLLRKMKGGQWVAVITKEGPPDYTMLIKNGDHPLPVLFEAKDCNGDRWALKNLHEHQARRLQQWHDIGGFACVLVGHQKTRTGYVLPWSRLGPIWQAWFTRFQTKDRALHGSASLPAGTMATIGSAWRFDDGFLPSMMKAQQASE